VVEEKIAPFINEVKLLNVAQRQPNSSSERQGFRSSCKKIKNEPDSITAPTRYLFLSTICQKYI